MYVVLGELYAGGYFNRPFVLSHTEKLIINIFNSRLMYPFTCTYSQHNISSL